MSIRNHNIGLKPGKSRQALTITHPNAVGIDIGSASHFAVAGLHCILINARHIKNVSGRKSDVFDCQ